MINAMGADEAAAVLRLVESWQASLCTAGQTAVRRGRLCARRSPHWKPPPSDQEEDIM